MKLSWLAKLVGIKEPAKASEQDIVTALEATVAAANESKPVVEALRKAMKKDDAALAEVLIFANATGDKQQGEGEGTGTAATPHDEMAGQDIAKLKTDLANCLAAGQKANEDMRAAQALVTARDATIATLTNERDEARTARASSEQSFVNERKLRTGTLLEIGLVSGKILLNEKETYEKDFANVASFDAAMDRYNKAVGGIAKLKVVAEVKDGGTRSSQEGDRQNQIATLVNETMSKEKMDYTHAFLKVKQTKPELFAGMKDPRDEQSARINRKPAK